MPPHQVGILHRFGLKMGIHFAHFGLKSQIGREILECMNVFIVSIQISKKEGEIYEFEIDFKKSFFVVALIQVMSSLLRSERQNWKKVKVKSISNLHITFFFLLIKS